MNKDVVLFIAIAGGLLIFGGLLFGFIYWASTSGLKPVQESGDRFLTALKNRAYEQAYDTMLTVRMRDLTSPGAMPEQLGLDDLFIEQWRWGRTEIIGEEVGRLTGEITFSNGQSRRFELKLLKVDESWLVDDFKLSP